MFVETFNDSKENLCKSSTGYDNAHLFIPTLGRLKQEEHEFETYLDYIVRLCLSSHTSSTPQNEKFNLRLEEDIKLKLNPSNNIEHMLYFSFINNTSKTVKGT